ncbi:MAG: DUF484 family protein [Candidatus Phaeomarinobacter sp.]
MTSPTETSGGSSNGAGKGTGNEAATPTASTLGSAGALRSALTQPVSDAKLDTKSVKAFLEANPDTLHDEPDLLAKLTPDAHREGDGVVDFQVFTIERLRQEIEDLRELQQAMVTAAEENAISRDRIFAAVLKVLDARNFEHLIHYITTELADDIEVDLVAMGVEASDSTSNMAGMRSPTDTPGGPSVMVLQSGMVDTLLGVRPDGSPRQHSLRDDVEGAQELFGPHAVQVQSEALIRMTFSRAAPPGILALGSTRANQFYPEQAVDHLKFLAQVIERNVRLWLDLPPA